LPMRGSFTFPKYSLILPTGLSSIAVLASVQQLSHICPKCDYPNQSARLLDNLDTMQ
jgi:hypothetical protein